LAAAVFILTGPTGAGKSQWAEAFARSAPVEIVSVDSALVYRGLDIGSAKPNAELRREIPHHLIDICDPAESYSAGRFVTDATACVRGILQRGKVPLLVGGTMLYLRALLHGLAPLPEASPEVRREIDARAAREGWSALHAELTQLDPEAAGRINSNDPQRIQRALEVCYVTGQPISRLQRDTISPLAGYRIRAWALAPADRALLHERLELRFHSMLAAGFVVTLLRHTHVCAPWVIVNCGRISRANMTWRRPAGGPFPQRASWPNDSSPGCAPSRFSSGWNPMRRCHSRRGIAT
jgi:tRNA dimethylallyltransferase